MTKEKLKCSNSGADEEFIITLTQSIYYGVAENETKEVDFEVLDYKCALHLSS